MADETDTVEDQGAEEAVAQITPAQAVEQVKADWPAIMGERPRLVAPTSVTERYDLLFTVEEERIPGQRVLAFALALAWRKLRRKLQTGGIVYKGDPADFGGKAFTWLVEKNGVTISELMVWGRASISVITGEQLPGLEITTSQDDAVGNSRDEEG